MGTYNFMELSIALRMASVMVEHQTLRSHDNRCQVLCMF